MKPVIAFLVLLFGSASPAIAERDTILEMLIGKSDIVVHVYIMQVEEGMTGSRARKGWRARCEVITCYKGDTEPGKKFWMHFIRRSHLERPWDLPGDETGDLLGDLWKEEPLKVRKGLRYILFLQSSTIQVRPDDKPETAYVFTDRWLGAQVHEINLEDAVVDNLKKKRTDSK